MFTKYLFVLGLIVSVVVVLKMNSGEIGADNLLTMISDQTESAETVSTTSKKPQRVIPEEDRDVRILAFGDMMLGRYVRTLMDRNGHDYIFAKIFPNGKQELMDNPDVVFGNLEGPIKGEGYKHQTAMVFGFHTDTAALLKKYGFNLLSLANNHAVDQGWDGRDSTIKALDQEGIDWCGHPSEADKESVYYGNYGEKSAAFICTHDVTYKMDVAAVENLIREVRPKVDFIVVSPHWGVEYQHQPNYNLQVVPARKFIDAGADIIIGHHPHVVQSFEVYNDKMIFYSLGNFVFDQYWSTATQEELAIGVVLDDRDEDEGFNTTVYLYPMKSEKSQSRLMTPEEKTDWIERFIGYGEYDEIMKEKIRRGVIYVEEK